MKKTKEALKWIVSILRKNNIKFEISGGFASRVYGSKRKLADIDIEVSDKAIPKIQKLTKKYIIYGPKEYKDKTFDLQLMTLKYRGQDIDICGKDSEKLYNKKEKRWIKETTDLFRAKIKKVYDLFIPIVPLRDLISYKKEIGRDVDKRDVRDLSNKQINKR